MRMEAPSITNKPRFINGLPPPTAKQAHFINKFISLVFSRIQTEGALSPFLRSNKNFFREIFLEILWDGSLFFSILDIKYEGAGSGNLRYTSGPVRKYYTYHYIRTSTLVPVPQYHDYSSIRTIHIQYSHITINHGEYININLIDGWGCTSTRRWVIAIQLPNFGH